MDAASHRRVTQIFMQACDLAAAEREQFVISQCAQDRELEQAVRAMLAADQHSADFLAGSPVSKLRALETATPERVGPYAVVGLLGRGAMGTVWEAEQESPRRRVAVKVLQAGSFSRSLLERFRYEAELLGRLQHPGIAQVFAAGSEDTPGGPRPWIAMELVRGIPLDRFADEQGLDVPARLELMAGVADAVQHAHLRGVVHRDLKCANVLVQPDGQVKVLDFGVARAEESDVRATLATLPGLLVGTLATMSPEQAAAAADVDARTDVYSLGAITYELLAGRPPLELSGLSIAKALMAIEQQEPPRLGALVPALAGDVEAVLAKALEKERERRYSSAAALADDLRRVVRGEAVEARPAGTLYLLSKLVRRHRALSAALVAVLLTTVGGITAFAVQAGATARSERKARAEAESAAAIDRFLLHDLLQSSTPHAAGRDVRVVDVLEQAAERVEAAFPDQPHVWASVRLSIARSQLFLGQLERSAELSRAAYQWRLEALGPRDRGTLEAAGQLLTSLVALERLDEGLPLARGQLGLQREVLGDDDATTLTTATDLASMLMAQGASDEAAALMQDVIARRTRTLGPGARQTLTTSSNLAALYSSMGRLDEAIELRREIVRRLTESYGPADADLHYQRSLLATSEFSAGRLADPVQTFEDCLRDLEVSWGPTHEKTLITRNALAQALRTTGRPEEAAALLESNIEDLCARLGPLHQHTLTARVGLAQALLMLGRTEEASMVSGELVDECASEPRYRLELGFALFLLGQAELGSGRREAGREALERSLETLAPLERPDAVAACAQIRDLLTRL